MGTKIPRQKSDHEEGKTKKEIEYGVMYPNGTVDWERDTYGLRSGGHIGTVEARKEFLEEYTRRFNQLNTNVEPRITFVQRTVTTKYGSLVPIIE